MINGRFRVASINGLWNFWFMIWVDGSCNDTWISMLCCAGLWLDSFKTGVQMEEALLSWYYIYTYTCSQTLTIGKRRIYVDSVNVCRNKKRKWCRNRRVSVRLWIHYLQTWRSKGWRFYRSSKDTTAMQGEEMELDNKGLDPHGPESQISQLISSLPM